MSGFYLGKKSLSNLIGVYPELGFVVTEAILITKQDFTVFDGIRTEEEQQALVDSGASWTMIVTICTGWQLILSLGSMVVPDGK